MSDNLEVLKFTVNYEDGTSFDVQVKGNDAIHILIPEATTYHMTIHFAVKGKTLTKLKYKQEVKKFSMTVRTRELSIGDEFAPLDEPYSVSFDKDTTPSGMMLRGDFDCLLTYYANDEQLYQVPWKLTVTKK